MDIAAERAYPTPLVNSNLFTTLLLSLTLQKHTPNTAKVVNTEYDYVIVGAGSAGSVVASRLSEMPCVSVLLLEAGKSPPYITEVPGITRFLWNTDIDWAYRTVPQRYTGRLLRNRQIVWPSGKTIGGSSILNGLMYARGNWMNFNDWADEGAEGWSAKEVYPYFLKFEDNRDPEYVANGFHAVGGPQTVHRPRYQPEIKDPIFQAAMKLGYKIVDANGARQSGFFDHQAFMRAGQRCGTGKAYLVPAENRTNLDILPNAMVRKVVIKNRHAVGVEFDFQDKTYVVKVRREVIMSAGTISTPQLLMLSGIGPRKELERHKIPVIADLPVGQNLQDHVAANVNFELSPTIQPYVAKLVNPLSIIEYIQNRTGPLGSSEFLSVLAWGKGDLKRPKVDFPNFQLVLTEALAEIGLQIGLTPEAYARIYAPYEGKPWFGCLSIPVQPRSRGTVTLNSTDPYDPPNIDPNYFDDPKDMDDLIDGLKLCNRIGTHPELRRVGSVPFQTVYPGCEPFIGDEEAILRCQIKAASFTLSHKIGTARMGNPKDPRTVVDPQLRVKYMQGLRVVDASVMPIIPSANTNAATLMIAEKASDIIKATIKCYEHATDKEEWYDPEDSKSDEPMYYPAHQDLDKDINTPYEGHEEEFWKRDSAGGKNILQVEATSQNRTRIKRELKVTPWNKENLHVKPWNQEILFVPRATLSANTSNRIGNTNNANPLPLDQQELNSERNGNREIPLSPLQLESLPRRSLLSPQSAVHRSNPKSLTQTDGSSRMSVNSRESGRFPARSHDLSQPELLLSTSELQNETNGNNRMSVNPTQREISVINRLYPQTGIFVNRPAFEIQNNENIEIFNSSRPVGLVINSRPSLQTHAFHKRMQTLTGEKGNTEVLRTLPQPVISLKEVESEIPQDTEIEIQPKHEEDILIRTSQNRKQVISNHPVMQSGIHIKSRQLHNPAHGNSKFLLIAPKQVIDDLQNSHVIPQSQMLLTKLQLLIQSGGKLSPQPRLSQAGYAYNNTDKSIKSAMQNHKQYLELSRQNSLPGLQSQRRLTESETEKLPMQQPLINISKQKSAVPTFGNSFRNMHRSQQTKEITPSVRKLQDRLPLSNIQTPTIQRKQFNISAQSNNNTKDRNDEANNAKSILTQKLVNVLGKNIPMKKSNAKVKTVTDSEVISANNRQYSSCDREFCSSLVKVMKCQEGMSCRKKREFLTFMYSVLCTS